MTLEELVPKWLHCGLRHRRCRVGYNITATGVSIINTGYTGTLVAAIAAGGGIVVK